MKTACIYHSIDLDGWMSAAIVKHWFAIEHREQEINIVNYNSFTDLDISTINPSNLIVFIGYNYGQPIPDLSEYDKVIMCDISFEPTVMKGLIDRLSNNFIWIDHHISAIKSCPQTLPYANSVDDVQPVSGIRDTKFAACELTWQHFFPNESMPEIVRLLGRYDCFGHKGTDEEQKVLEFQYGARQAIPNYNTAYDYLMYNLQDDVDCVHGDEHVVNRLHIEGIAIYQYLCTEAKQTYKNGFEIELNVINKIPNIKELGFKSASNQRNYKFICINKERFNPINFSIDYHKDGYDGAACFHFDGTHWCFSLYNDNGEVDCSQIAKQFGGGGHKGAAGFRLPFKDTNIDSFIRARILQNAN